MTVVSFFAGMEGFGLAFERAGFKVVAHVEIDPNCLKLLAAKFPGATIITDIRAIPAVQRRIRRGKPVVNYEKWKAILELLTNADVFCGGWPCQDLSVAGCRAGLVGERSGLWFTLRRIIGLFRPTWFVGENVPGLLSSHQGRDAAEVFRGLAKLRYWWAYRVLDAQYFNLAQRRERVFIVAGPSIRGVAEVLFEPESVCWNPAPSREERKEITPTIGGCSNGGGANGPGRTVDDCESLVPVTSNPIAGHHSRNDLDNDTYVMSSGQANSEIVKDGSPSLTCLHEAPIVSGYISPRALRNSDSANEFGIKGGQVHDCSQSDGPGAIAFSSKDSGADASVEISPTLRALNFKESHMNGGGQVAIAFQERGRPEGRTVEAQSELAYSLNSPKGGGRTQENNVAIAFDTTQVTSKGNYSNPKPGEPCHPLAAGAHPPAVAFPANMSATQCAASEEVAPVLQSDNPTAIAFKPSHFTRDKDGAPSETAPPLSADADKGDQDPVVFQPRYYTRNNKTGGAPSETVDVTNCKKAGDSAPHVSIASTVRRLTPTECERLMGFPDNYFDGLNFSDSVKYRMIGNSVAVPCVEFIAHRLMAAIKLVK